MSQVEKRLHELRELASEYADAKSERVYIEEFKKTKLAELMKVFEPDYPTAAAQEREARNHKEYRELLKGLKEATRVEAKAQWELKIAEWGVSLYQTKSANE